MYGSIAWNPILRKDINLLKKVQKCFTMLLHGIRDNKNIYVPYEKRLQMLGALSLEQRRLYAYPTFVYKVLYRLVDCDPSDFGQTLKNSCTKADELQLTQHGAASQATCH